MQLMEESEYEDSFGGRSQRKRQKSNQRKHRKNKQSLRKNK